MKKKKIYASGGKVNTYIETPGEALSKNAYNMDLSMIEGMTDPLSNILEGIGNFAMQAGTQLAGSAVGGVGGDVIKGSNPLLQGLAKMAYGGVIPNTQIEAEGGEIVETPDGGIEELKGPSHEQGGIDLFLPPGTEIFSDRLTGSDGKTMAERKKAREKKLSKTQKLLEKNPSDATLKKTLEKIKISNEKEEQSDLAQMEEARNLYNSNMGKMMMGGIIEQYFTGGFVEDENSSIGKQILDNINIGDGIGMIGNLINTFGLMNNTKANRAGDTPNVNAFKDFGKDALEAIEDSKDYVNIQKDDALADINLASTSQIKRNRNSARGVNQMRALDLATSLQDKRAKSDIHVNVAQMMQSILSQQAQLENQQDSVVMQGEQNRDLADRQDRDNFYSQLAQDITTKGTGLQKIGKDLNKIKSRNTTGNVMKDLFDNYFVDPNTGQLIFKSDLNKKKG